jgi:hypothetical protein
MEGGFASSPWSSFYCNRGFNESIDMMNSIPVVRRSIVSKTQRHHDTRNDHCTPEIAKHVVNLMKSLS